MGLLNRVRLAAWRRLREYAVGFMSSDQPPTCPPLDFEWLPGRYDGGPSSAGGACQATDKIAPSMRVGPTPHSMTARITSRSVPATAWLR